MSGGSEAPLQPPHLKMAPGRPLARLNLGTAEYPSLLSLTVPGYPQAGWLGPGAPAYVLGWHDSDTWHYQGSQCPL